MMRRRFNFDIILDATDPASLAHPRPGDKIQVERSEAEVVLRIERSNVRVGTLPSGALDAYHPNVTFEGFVRCVARHKESHAIERICVSLAPCKKKREVEVPRWEQETIDEEWLLKPQHYEALGGWDVPSHRMSIFRNVSVRSGG